MTSIQAKILSRSGKIEYCEIQFDSPFSRLTIHSQRFGLLTFQAENLFSAMSKYRVFLEGQGFTLLCNGARRDAYPSRMCLQMGGGRKIYLLKNGQQAKKDDLVDIFEEAPVDSVCSVAEQQEFYKEWINSL